MKITSIAVLFSITSASAFTAPTFFKTSSKATNVVLKGYLDDLSKELYAESSAPDSEDIENSTKEATNMSKDQIDRYGPGSLQDFVDFDEFDGGDGQMGVAGDGNKGLEKIGGNSAPSIFNSKSMSAKNAWGTDTGYADKLINEKGMDVQRAQQLENWQNQQEVRAKQLQQREMTEKFEEQQESAEQDWRTLAKFGVERNQDFDLDETFGEVAVGGDFEDTIQMVSSINRIAVHEFQMKNQFMGFADFRCAFTSDSNVADWTVSPTEGALSKEPTEFIVKFKPNNPGTSQAYLVMETEDFKKTWLFIGSTN